MEGKINVFGDADVMFAVYKDGSYTDTIPGKDDGYRFDKAVCTNGATATWNKTDWSVKVNSLTKTKTKCSLYFLTGEEPAGGTKIEDKFNNLLNDSYYSDQIIYEQNDGDNNIRFIGVDPDNYVTFNEETWRIIGLMDNVQTKSSGPQKLLKIIRKDSLGTYNWDKSAYGVNEKNGVNEWSQADLMYALKRYGGESVSNCGDSSCPGWTTLKSDAKSMIEEVTWYTGTLNKTGWENLIKPRNMYSAERSTTNGKQCSEGYSCNDDVERTTKWTGKVGLMSISDYGFATNGGQLKNREQCLEMSMFSWYIVTNTNTNTNVYCYVNDWLHDLKNRQWTMTPVAHSSDANRVLYVDIGTNRVVSSDVSSQEYAVRPVVYLKSSVKITGGDGTSRNPYTLAI